MDARTSNIVNDANTLVPQDFFSSELKLLKEDDKRALVLKAAEGKVKLAQEAQEKIFLSNLAQNDMSNFVDNVNTMDSSRKIYTAKTSVRTGSGSCEMNVKGGDANFIAPVLWAIGIVIVAGAILLKVVFSK